MSTLLRMKTPTSSNVRRTHTPPGAFELTSMGSNLNSRMGCKAAVGVGADFR
jgi:hypothetical protein